MQENNKQDEFRVGDTVYCVIYGKGRVHNVHNVLNAHRYTYPLHVVFDSDHEQRYTLDGKFGEDQNRSLFFSEPKIEASVTRPFVPTLVGKRVVVQYYDGTWIPHPVVVTEETEEEIFTKNGSDYKSDLIAIREVSSENLLTSKK